MAGEARTTAFMLGTATLMLGPQDKLFDLNVEEHSIGLVKNLTVGSTPTYTDLTQGVKNQLVYSVMTNNEVRISGEVYEYTSKNISYAAGLDGSELEAISTSTTTSAAMVLTGGTTADEIPVTSATGLAAGDWIMVQVGNDDQVFLRQIVAISSNNVEVPTGFPVAIPQGSLVSKVNTIGVGSKEEQPYLAAKIVGTLADGDEIVILVPKVRITSGASLSFRTDDYGNIPMELGVYDLVSTDPHYALFQPIGSMMVATRT